MSQYFTVSNRNPNDDTGGGGCACSEIRTDDTQGPFIVFPATETSSNISPHVVVCERCICDAERTLASITLPDPEEEVVEVPAGDSDVAEAQEVEVIELSEDDITEEPDELEGGVITKIVI